MPANKTHARKCLLQKTKIQALTEHVSDENPDLLKLVKI